MTLVDLRPAAVRSGRGSGGAAGGRIRRSGGGRRASLLLLATAAAVGVAAAGKPALVLAAFAGLALLGATIRNPSFGLALFTVLAFFDRTTAFQSGGITPVKSVGALLAILLLLVVCDRNRRAPLLTSERPLVAAAALFLVVWALLSSLWATDETHAVSTTIRLAQGVILVFVVYTFVAQRAHLRWIVRAFVVGALIAVLVGQVGGYTSASVNDGRLSGGFDDPNELAAVLVPAIVFCAFGFVATHNALLRGALVGCAGLFGVALARSDSQAGIVALAVALLLAVAFTGRIRRLAAASVAVLVLSAGFYYTFVTKPVALQTITSDNNTSNRKTLWAVAARIVEHHPVVGIGAGNFVVVEASYAIDDMNLRRADLVAKGEIVHNTYLEVLAELGGVGLLTFLGLVATALAGCVRAVRIFERAGDRELELLTRSVFVGTVALLTAYTFATNTYEKQLWLLIGLGISLPGLARRSVVAAQPGSARVEARRSGPRIAVLRPAGLDHDRRHA